MKTGGGGSPRKQIVDRMRRDHYWIEMDEDSSEDSSNDEDVEAVV